nr:MAG TPA: PGDYG protein [Caudoviricetes sp.]
MSQQEGEQMKYRKKPVVIDAFQWTGGLEQEDDSEWILEAIKNKTAWFKNGGTPDVKFMIQTLEGVHEASVGDYIIRGIAGEIYPCKPDIFRATYEPLNN